MLLLQQYREKDFKKYSKLISRLLVVEQNNKLLLKNHESLNIERNCNSASFSKVNATIHNNYRNERNHDRGRGHEHG